MGAKSLFATLAVGAMLLSSCDNDGAASQTSSAPNDAAAAPMTADVTVQSFAFRETTVTVAVGGEVTFTNKDVQAHPLRFDDGRMFDLAGGDTAVVTFDEPGVFAYRCAVHASMTGTVIAGETDTNVTDNNSGGMSRSY